MIEETIMNKRLLSIFSLITMTFLILLSSQNSFACSCLANLKPLKTQVKDAFDNSGAVFSGEILEIAPKGEWEVLVKIKVEKSWKAKLFQEVTLKTEEDSAMCGFGFEIGQKYLVYAYGNVNSLATNNCSRTALFKYQEDIEFLNMFSSEKPKAALVDSFAYSNSEDGSARLDNFRIELNNSPQNKGFVMIYGGKNGKRGEVDAHIRGIKQAFRLKGIDDKKVVVHKGGYREKLTIEFWVIPLGTDPPKPNPTVNSKKVRFNGISKKMIPYECCF
jgi:hypothetical protein